LFEELIGKFVLRGAYFSEELGVLSVISSKKDVLFIDTQSMEIFARCKDIDFLKDINDISNSSLVPNRSIEG